MSSSTRPRRRPRVLPAYYLLLLGLLYLPIGILFLFSVNANTSVAFPLRGFTLEWYRAILDTGALMASFQNSIVVAVGSAAIFAAIARRSDLSQVLRVGE
jgi:spermidine/putrescine transport system permease protein